MSFPRSSLLCFLLAIYIFIYSLIISPFATEGDQVHYRDIYEAIGSMGLLQAAGYYYLNLDSKEILHFIFSLVFSWLGVSKDLFVASSNGILAFVSAKMLINFRVNYLIITLIVGASFYFNVLYFSAERLKFGFIFFFWAMIYFRNVNKFFMLCMFSILGHLQLIINLVIALSSCAPRLISRFMSNGLVSKKLFYGLLVFFICLAPLADQIERKFFAYVSAFDPLAFIKVSIFCILSCLYFRPRAVVIFAFLPQLFLVSLIGGDRLTMIAYFTFLFFGLQYRRGMNAGVIISVVYFSIKTIEYISLILLYGNGFYRAS